MTAKADVKQYLSLFNYKDLQRLQYELDRRTRNIMTGFNKTLTMNLIDTLTLSFIEILELILSKDNL